MNPAKVDRQHLLQLTDLPNVGPACEKDLHLIGIRVPAQLRGRDAYDMHAQLCLRTGVSHAPCMIDVFLSILRFMDGEAAQPWWKFSAERKAKLASEAPLALR
ncbi:helix-hairpin-helix domain-containing protein [Xanthomonas oryzae pv. oryzae]|uniref:Mitomycin resistance protein n=3 Tax=Xanthomonas oryzae pv. oryzae TaxID=64187 RepID=Q5H5L3_XANOR|nr:helix-hairpin-helix domain-containing protein [Xanthomonas oryzae]AAW73757.1 mitomycin resistance protein [Xanthomonas oryzae pv. oryzae KACC 10331]ACD61286.1 mitomycin resistance protein [Xanthomonas oryzae pv. oryzae PXO99A]AJQ85021.1 mitomycin resistance protein [Xanthomonas oryzae pv. oryzae PXO86]ALZ73602.1 mitomycin resistance protein [Xanthomonas oryzae pv. oryzae]AOS08228.1 mitomycin resistance protein [Xanthomonas oryzae pv. oryzae]